MARPATLARMIRRTLITSAVVALTAGALVGCSAASAPAAAPVVAVAGDLTLTADALWDAGVVHDVAIDVDEAALQTALETYVETGEKVWIEATIVIDGVRFERVGLKLKGNSSLRGASADDDPATLPWILRLDTFVDDQTWDGWSELVIRGNSSATSLNEAVALGLLEATGLAAQAAIASAVSFNGGEAQLRLVVQNPDEQWTAEELGAGTLLYKAESTGSWDDVGDDPADYAVSFDQEAGADDLTPIVELMDFLNNADDATFAAELADHLDIEAFATYLAFQDLVGNTDDIDGPGNNSYLAIDPDTGVATVVNWDLNLAFGGAPGGGMGGPGMGGGAMGDRAELPEGFTPPEGRELPEGFTPPEGGMGELPDGMEPPAGMGMGGAGGPGQGNILADRFRADATFAAMIEDAADRLQTELVDSGLAAELLEQWTTTLTDGAGDLVSAESVQTEAAAIASALGVE